MSSVDKSVLGAGNHSSCPSLQAIKRITSDGRKMAEKDPDIWLDLTATIQEDNSPIRILSYTPFILAWHTKEQMQFLKTLRVPQLYLGCTGHFVKGLTDSPVYYYALIVRPGAGKPDFPIAEMLTESEHGFDVAYWLNVVVRDMMEFASFDIRNSRTKVVVDGGEALRDAAAEVFLRRNVQQYVSDCTSAEETEQVSPSLHTCGVQEMHAVMEAVSKMTHTLEGEQTALRLIRALQKTSDLNAALDIVKWASAVFSARFVTQRVSVAIANLERAISGQDRAEIVPERHRHAKVVVPDSFEGSDPKKSPLYNVFFKSLCQLNNTQLQDVAQYENALCIPGFIEYLLQSHLAHLPLWWNSTSSGAPSCLADCVAEKWFHRIKIDVLRGQKNLKPGRFFRLQVDLVAALLKDAQKEQ